MPQTGQAVAARLLGALGTNISRDAVGTEPGYQLIQNVVSRNTKSDGEELQK